MAFGSSMKASNDSASSGEFEKKEWPWLDLHSGVRTFRILPELDSNGTLLLIDGRVQPESEVSWYEAWWEVMIGGNTAKRRFMLGDRWKNPLWSHIQENFEKGSMEWKAIKQKFAVNIYDRSAVLFGEDGLPVYANEKNQYTITAMGKVLDSPLKGDPTPHNKILILEGSAGKIGGKHLLNQLFELTGNIDNPNTGETATLAELDLKIKTTGKGIETNRNIFPTTNFKELPDDVLYAPRWDIASWCKPWPDDMIIRAIEGEDFNELVQEFGIKLFPELKVQEQPSQVLQSSANKKTQKSTKPKPKTEDDEALFDD